MYQKQFSSEKIQIHKGKRPNSNLVFFSEIKKNKFGNLVFFSEKKNPNLKEKKNQEFFFVFSHGRTLYVDPIICVL